jgi:hypothetical protein
MYLAKLQVTVTRDRQYGTGLSHIVKCYTNRNDPICTESFKVTKASTLLSVISTLLYVISTILSAMGHWEFCRKSLSNVNYLLRHSF